MTCVSCLEKSASWKIIFQVDWGMSFEYILQWYRTLHSSIGNGIGSLLFQKTLNVLPLRRSSRELIFLWNKFGFIPGTLNNLMITIFCSNSAHLTQIGRKQNKNKIEVFEMWEWFIWST